MPVPALGSWVDWKGHLSGSQKIWVLISVLALGLLCDLKTFPFSGSFQMRGLGPSPYA